jgi:sugar lactone lactonase YvrE
MADHQVLTTDVAVDDVNVYWTEVGPSDAGATVNGNVKSLPKTSTGGGIPTTLASGQDYPEAIAVNASAAYWVNSNGQTVQKVGLDGGAPVVLAMFQNGVNALAIDDTSVYWTNYAGSVVTTPLGGGTVATIGGGLSPWGLAVGSGTVYWVSYVNTNYTSLNLYARPPDGGAVATMGSVSNLGNPQRRGVATDSTYVYFSGEYLYRVPIAGGTVTTIAMSPIWPNDIAVDDQNVYWTAGASNWGMVARAPLAGGATTTLATNQPYPGGIAVDGTSVYWVNGGTNTSLSTDGTVMKLTPK